MRLKETSVFALLIVFAIGFGAVACVIYVRQLRADAQSSRVDRAMMLMDADESAIMGSKPDIIGKKDLKFTLIEFGDYQCPPCRAAFPVASSLTKQYANEMRFQFRNMPLERIHPYALNAAIVAEEARMSGKFWGVHDALYETPLDDNALARIARDNGLASPFSKSASRQAAELAVRDDIHDAQSLGVNRTPTFILCCPGHKAYRLLNLDQVPQFIRG